MTYFCAVDGGNSTINIVINGKKFKRSFPTIQSDPAAARLSYVNNAVFGKDSSKQLWSKLHAETTLNFDTPGQTFRSEFIMGHMAEEFKKEFRSRDNKEKYQDKDLAKMMITALAYALFETKREEESIGIKQDMELEFRVVLATGLPYREGRYPEKRKVWSDIFKGTHKVNFMHPDFKNLTINIVVEDMVSVIEGEMALNLELNKPGGIIETSESIDLLNKQMAIIDIGGHTTEIVTVAYEMVHDEDYDEFDEDYEINVQQVTKVDLTYGTQRGIATIMDDVLTDVMEKYRAEGKPLRHLTRRDIELAFSIRGMIDGKKGYILPERIYIGDMFKRRAENLANEIISQAHSMFGSIISSLDTIYLCGGGSRMQPVVTAIKDQLATLGYNRERIITLDDPIYANVKGYYLILTYKYPDEAMPLAEE